MDWRSPVRGPGGERTNHISTVGGNPFVLPLQAVLITPLDAIECPLRGIANYSAEPSRSLANRSWGLLPIRPIRIQDTSPLCSVRTCLKEFSQASAAKDFHPPTIP
jgi:hypothetical protein